MATVNIGNNVRPVNVELPDQPTMQDVTLSASTHVVREDGSKEKVPAEFQSPFPQTLADAIAHEGVKAVFKRYCSSLAIERQGEKRKELAPENKKPRQKAAWLDDLDL